MISQHEDTRLIVRSPEGEYPIVLGRGLLDRVGSLARELALGERVVIATDTTVQPLYAEQVARSLAAESFVPHIAAMRAGEEHKNWASVQGFVDSFIDAQLDRGGWVLALGGGVVGDTAGFAASIYMRGVPLVQVPTTLLAMADSSIGGKVGIDHARGKNLLGAFKQPRLVVADLDTLHTLPSRELACGMAEIVKAGIIGDPDLFDMIESASPEDLELAGALLRAMRVKRDIVERDPHEAGERALLNLGHTFGHAFEHCTGYARPHGYAVAQGMVVACRLAVNLDLCDPSLEARLRSVLEAWNLPTHWAEPDLTSPEALPSVLSAMQTDKKRLNTRPRLILPRAPGNVIITADIPPESIANALEQTR
jgi:3-dehydroquinate synthase